jgi:hypothetical protein
MAPPGDKRIAVVHGRLGIIALPTGHIPQNAFNIDIAQDLFRSLSQLFRQEMHGLAGRLGMLALNLPVAGSAEQAHIKKLFNAMEHATARSAQALQRGRIKRLKAQ